MSKKPAAAAPAAAAAAPAEEKKAEVVAAPRAPPRAPAEVLAAAERAFAEATRASGGALLSVASLGKVMEGVGVRVRADLAPVVFRAADADASGTLSLVEFQHLFVRARALQEVTLTPQQVRARC